MLRKFAAIVLTLVAVLAAGWLALKRPDIPYGTLEAEYRVPASDFLTISGDVKIHYTDEGPRDAPVLVLVHGFSSSLHTWRPWAEDLQDAYRVITLDLPGHGLSRVPEDRKVSIDYYVETLDEVMRRIGVERFSLAGSSMGGNVAWQYALAHPDALDSLVLVDAAGWPDSDGAGTPIIMRILRIPVARTLIKDLDLSRLIEDGLKKSVADPLFVSTQMTERYAALSRAPGHRDALLHIAATGNARERASQGRLSAIAVPTLILWGEQDGLIPVSHAERFANAIPNAVAITYPDAGHLPQEEVAAESVADLRAFLDQYGSGAPAISPLDNQATADSSQPLGGPAGGALRPR